MPTCASSSSNCIISTEMQCLRRERLVRIGDRLEGFIEGSLGPLEERTWRCTVCLQTGFILPLLMPSTSMCLLRRNEERERFLTIEGFEARKGAVKVVICGQDCFLYR